MGLEAIALFLLAAEVPLTKGWRVWERKILPATRRRPPADWWRPGFDDRDWELRDLPIKAEERWERPGHTEWWLRKDVVVPDSGEGWLVFDRAIDDEATIYIDGKRLFTFHSFYAPWEKAKIPFPYLGLWERRVEVPLGKVRRGQKLTIAVHLANNWEGLGGLYEGVFLKVEKPKERLREVVALPVPEPRSPPNGMTVTDVALFFLWRNVKGAKRYELQLSREPNFKAPVVVWMEPLYPHPAGTKGKVDFCPWFPDEPSFFGEGKWFWRVRAVGEGGKVSPWSGIRSFTVDRAHPQKPLVRSLSPEKPPFLHLGGPEGWWAFPEDLRPYMVIRWEIRSADCVECSKRAMEMGVPIVYQCSGPWGWVYREVYGTAYGRVSLAELEWAFQHCPNIIGALINEQVFHLRRASSKEYVKRLLILCAKYGRLLIWPDGHWGKYFWLDVGADPELVALFRKHADYIIPLHKMNCGWVPLLIHNSVFGLWAAGMVKNFGVEPESWFWYEAGFGRLGERRYQDGQPFKGGEEKLCPPTFWGYMTLLGLTCGATCWCIEPPWQVWEGRKLTKTWEKVMVPLFRAIVKRELIPEREEVLKQIKIACQARLEDTFVKHPESRDFRNFRRIFEGTYGLRHEKELIPNTGRFFFIPILPALTEGSRLPRHWRVLRTDSFPDAEGFGREFQEAYPAFYRGGAFVARVEDLVVVMNTHENRDVTEDFELPLEWGEIKAIGGRVPVHSYAIFHREGEGLWLHANGREERNMTLWVEAGAELEVQARPEEALMVKREGVRLILEIFHKWGAVEATIAPRR